jgi:hypothetical protein
VEYPAVPAPTTTTSYASAIERRVYSASPVRHPEPWRGG